jgi:hypothetical protein
VLPSAAFASAPIGITVLAAPVHTACTTVGCAGLRVMK